MLAGGLCPPLGKHFKRKMLQSSSTEKLDRSARICLQILAAKCLQVGFARR
jgi:hypothetical protein